MGNPFLCPLLAWDSSKQHCWGVRVPRQGVNTLVTAGDHPRQDVTPWSHQHSWDPSLRAPPFQPPSAHPGQAAIPHSEDPAAPHTGDPPSQVRPTPARSFPSKGNLDRGSFLGRTQPPATASSFSSQGSCTTAQAGWDPIPSSKSNLGQRLPCTVCWRCLPYSTPGTASLSGPMPMDLPCLLHPTAPPKHRRTGRAPRSAYSGPFPCTPPSGCPQPGRTRRASHPPHPGTGFSPAGQDGARPPTPPRAGESLFRQEKTNSPQDPGQDEIPSSWSPASRTRSHLCRRSRPPPKHA